MMTVYSCELCMQSFSNYLRREALPWLPRREDTENELLELDGRFVCLDCRAARAIIEDGTCCSNCIVYGFSANGEGGICMNHLAEMDEPETWKE